ncbi:MAG: glycine cleavage system protein GcvH [Candidatus Omnitrophota bacterium]|nr:MAG: glycine cleavage system protein GcvH [Candidatus Omnitrophota bacterium]
MGELRFAKSHEWARVDNDIITVGITDYAQKELGDIVFVELPKVGDSVQRGSAFGTIESTKTASELYAPVSGKVAEVNSELTSNPQWVNEDPLGRGWMIAIKANDSSELGSLMDEPAYEQFIEKESH